MQLQEMEKMLKEFDSSDAAQAPKEWMTEQSQEESTMVAIKSASELIEAKQELAALEMLCSLTDSQHTFLSSAMTASRVILDCNGFGESAGEVIRNEISRQLLWRDISSLSTYEEQLFRLALRIVVNALEVQTSAGQTGITTTRLEQNLTESDSGRELLRTMRSCLESDNLHLACIATRGISLIAQSCPSLCKMFRNDEKLGLSARKGVTCGQREHALLEYESEKLIKLL